jgi:NTP pyrophosphatase (non-canonical NTP hydrolase)
MIMANDPAIGELAQLRDLVRQFVDERDWDQFLQHGRIEELGPDKLVEVRHEMADVLVYLVRLADKLDVDLPAAVQEKMVLNRAKYPAEQVRGDARKYHEYKS